MVLSVKSMTVAFATTRDHNRIKQMRKWTRRELAATSEPSWLSQLFLFTSLPENMAETPPRQLFLESVWYTPTEDDKPVSLLGE